MTHHPSVDHIPVDPLFGYGVAARASATSASIVHLASSLIRLSSCSFPPHFSLPPSPNLRLCGMCGHVRLCFQSFPDCAFDCASECVACARMCGIAVEVIVKMHRHVHAAVRHVPACAVASGPQIESEHYRSERYRSESGVIIYIA